MSRIDRDAASPVSRPSPGLAALAALVWPGTGHLYAGHPARAFGVAAVTAFLLVPVALRIWVGATGGAFRLPAALVLLALPALDAARLAAAGRPFGLGARRAGVAAVGLALATPVFLLVEYTAVTSRWLAAMALDRESMRPNLVPGDLLLVDVRPEAIAAAVPGDLVVFEHPPGSGRLHVKRMVARAGQAVQLQDGGLVLDGAPRMETRGDPGAVERIGDLRFATLPGAPAATPAFGPVTVPPGSFFALGDDRSVSRDSRAFGPVSESLLRGLPVRILWSHDPVTKALRSGRSGADPRSAP